ncbi:hypothetical protein GCM10011316_21560 [Roseibium aquae]|uniref:Uncharacterized protein n=1 Tax=Roseibium aquae TaxID=1323746 RepID=A0A916TKM2_9HYPH|nr:hypothetical protein [Roseibium aquae]GGB49112.1 hypothetical protein GCM10011316_21560 [Roseibium aquae]
MDDFDPDHRKSNTPLSDARGKPGLPPGVKEIDYSFIDRACEAIGLHKVDKEPANTESVPDVDADPNVEGNQQALPSPKDGFLASCKKSEPWAPFDDVEKTKARMERYSSSDLLDSLSDFKDLIDSSSDAEAFTKTTRKSFIAANIVLNERVRAANDPAPAPAFRPQPKRNKAPKGHAADLSNIVRVIDMHFCWMIGHRPAGRHVVAIFGQCFDFDEAYRFVTARGRNEKKLGHLGLVDTLGAGYCRLGNASFKTEGDRSIWRYVIRKREQYRSDLINTQLKASVNREEWANLLASGYLLTRHDIAITGQKLMTIMHLLGQTNGDRPTRYMQKYGAACRALGISKPDHQSRSAAATG